MFTSKRFIRILCNLGIQYNNRISLSLSEGDIPCDDRLLILVGLGDKLDHLMVIHDDYKSTNMEYCWHS